MGAKKRQSRKRPPGPAPETLKVEGAWKEAVKRSLEKKKPAQGWPKTDQAKG
jgi:hypothetical protein